MSEKEPGLGISKRITTATTTLVKTGAGSLKRLIIGTTAAGTITIYDALSAVDGTQIVVIKASMPEGSYEIGSHFRTGLCVVTGAASDITLIYE